MVAAMDDRRTVPVWVKRAIVGFWVGGLLTFYAVGVIRALGTLIVVLIVSVFVAFALEPAVNAMARRGIRRGIGTAIAFLVVAAAAAGFSALIGTALASETTYLIDKAPGYIDDIEGWLDDTFGIEVEFDTLKDEFLAGGGAQDLASRFADDVVNAGATVVSLLFHLFTVALFTFYLVADGPKLRRMVSARLSERRAAIVTEIWDLAMHKTGGYMYSRTILAVISALVHWGAFALLDVPSPIALAIWVGVISQFIPAIGAYIAGVLPVLVALLHEPRTGLFVLIVIVAYQQLENYLLSPRITAHTMEIHVALAFGSVIAGTALMGIVGAFLALPVAATAQAFITSWLDQRARPDEHAEAEPADAEPASNESAAGEPAGA
ncbi:MAG: AI-2E family transporter [Acidimicrobiaceae bacterium]|nr:AI-2E family transporter [Acidimicrobiaceae bacterium]MYA86266.1 AI-2E family transporter [Acidimicrobiaceae bacterium]MYH78300.1 AI-2E family transporter [Acidimicrobiaceae bacterium]